VEEFSGMPGALAGEFGGTAGGTMMKRPGRRWVLCENPVNCRREPTLQAGKREGRRGCLALVQTETARSARGMNQGKSPGKVQAPERGPTEAGVVSRASLALACLFVRGILMAQGEKVSIGEEPRWTRRSWRYSQL
jgi:hypothetical protein